MSSLTFFFFFINLFICILFILFLAALGLCCCVGFSLVVASRAYAFFFFLIYLFMAVLNLRCCAQAFSTCGERGLLFIAVRRLLTVVASLVAEHRL